MTSVEWDPNARKFLKKLPKDVSRRIFTKIDAEVKNDVERFLERVVQTKGYKIRVGDYRLFVDYNRDSDHLIIRAVEHRSRAYKRL